MTDKIQTLKLKAKPTDISISILGAAMFIYFAMSIQAGPQTWLDYLIVILAISLTLYSVYEILSYINPPTLEFNEKTIIYKNYFRTIQLDRNTAKYNTLGPTPLQWISISDSNKSFTIPSSSIKQKLLDLS